MKKASTFRMVLMALVAMTIVLAGCSQTKDGNQPGSGEGDSAAQSKYPEKPINWIIPLAPGGNSDLIARVTGKYLVKYLPGDVNIIYDNKPGGAGIIGLTELYNSKADGYTIATSPAAALTIKTVEGQTEYSYDSFQPIANIASVAQILVVPASAPYQTFAEWLEYVKQNPGFKVAVSGAMNAQQLAMEAFATEAGIELEFVAYGGEGEFVTALLGGHVQSGLLAQTVLKPHYETGDLTPIVNITSVKPDFLPDIPTLQEEGYEAEGVFFNGVIAPGGIPEDVFTILADAFKQAIEDPELREEMESLGQIMDYKNPADYQELITRNAESNREVMRNLGIIE